MEAVVAKCAGLDVHLTTVVASILCEREQEEVYETKNFGLFYQNRKRLCQWLAQERVDLVIMESTGIYWRALHRDLEAVGLRVFVVNARRVKHVPGRKTDVLDSQWLAKLGRHGLLNPSFVPPTEFQDLREISRYRMKLRDTVAGEKNRLHKVLVSAGIYLSNVVSDIHGMSAKKIIQGLIEGKPVAELVDMAYGRLKAKRALLVEALECPLPEAAKQMLKAITDHIRYVEWEISEQENHLLQGLKPYQQELQILQTIPGQDVVAAATLLVEIGPDMGRFGNASHLASWCGVCPGQNESAGKRKSGKTRHGNLMVRRILCEVANAARNTKTQFRGKYQSLVVRRGHKRAIIALGHKILRVVFALLRDKKPYHDSGVDYEAELIKRNAPRWVRVLEKYGYIVPDVKASGLEISTAPV